MPMHDPFGITRLEAWPLAVPLRDPFVVATGAMEVAENVFVRVTLANGVRGYGEMAPFPAISGEDQQGSLHAFPAAASVCLGQSATQYRKISHLLDDITEAMPAVRCGIETAVLDALCRGMGVPLWSLWGGADVRGRSTDVTLPIGSIEQVVQAARAWYARGFRMLKMKIGQEVEEDIRRIEAVSSACPGSRFILDANQGFSFEEAQDCLRHVERLQLPVVLFEQPLPREDIEGMAALRQETAIPLAADESVRSFADARELIRRQAVDVLNLKITKCGVVNTVDIAGLAKATGTGLMIGGMVESRVAMGCSWSLVLGLGGFDFVDLDMPLLLADDPVQGGYRYEGPDLMPWQDAGLGMEMKQELPPSVLVIE